MMADDPATRDQTNELSTNIGPMLALLSRLQRRMEQTGKQGDELYGVLGRAYDVMTELRLGLRHDSQADVAKLYVIEPPKRDAES